MGSLMTLDQPGQAQGVEPGQPDERLPQDAGRFSGYLWAV